MPSVIKIKSTHSESQGPFVLIDDYNFDPSKGHELFDPPPPPPPPPFVPPPPPGPPDPLKDLGADWQSKDATELRKLAEVVSGRSVENKKQAVEVIEAALKARA